MKPKRIDTVFKDTETPITVSEQITNQIKDIVLDTYAKFGLKITSVEVYYSMKDRKDGAGINPMINIHLESKEAP